MILIVGILIFISMLFGRWRKNEKKKENKIDLSKYPIFIPGLQPLSEYRKEAMNHLEEVIFFNIH